MPERWDIPPDMAHRMHEVAQDLRQCSPLSEALLWEALRNRKLDGRKFRRQEPIGPFVLDFYCASEKLAVEVDGPIHESQQEDDQERQKLIESLGIHFVRVTSEQVEKSLPTVIGLIRAAFKPDKE